jgi:aminoglycoside phosphotransferase family enzyme/predicted kinase
MSDPSEQLPPSAEPHSAPELVRSLLRPQAYPQSANPVTLVETHISWVFLTPERVFKVKKPVRFPFLDYSTPELRRRACEDEVRLNRRLAPDVYLGVLPITTGADGLARIGGDGPALDWCVAMKRLPAAPMFDRRITAGTATPDDMERLLDVLVPFYASAARGPEIEQHGSVAVIAANARENFSTLDGIDHGLPRPLFLRTRAGQYQFLHLAADLFARRLASGYVCEGHGDLRPEHVCLLDPPVVFDCVEFSLAFRSADVLGELAFLAMECDFLGAPDLSSALLTGYRRRTADDAPDALFRFYQSYRACIRAKVELLRAAQQDEPAAGHSRQRGRRYLQLASFHANAFQRPQLFVMLGATGTGKSTVADAVAEALGLEVLRTDAIRHELAGGNLSVEGGGWRVEGEEHPPPGMYSDDMTCRTYDTLFERAAMLLDEAVSVVLDGTFRDVAQRDRAVRLAHEKGAGAHFLFCQAPPDVARERIAGRIARGEGISDARPELHEVHRRELDAAPDWSGPDVLPLDTTQPVGDLVRRVIDRLRHTVALPYSS